MATDSKSTTNRDQTQLKPHQIVLFAQLYTRLANPGTKPSDTYDLTSKHLEYLLGQKAPPIDTFREQYARHGAAFDESVDADLQELKRQYVDELKDERAARSAAEERVATLEEMIANLRKEHGK